MPIPDGPSREGRETTLAFRLASLRADTREAERALDEFRKTDPLRPIPYGTVMHHAGFDSAYAIRVDSWFHRKNHKHVRAPGWLVVWSDSSNEFVTDLSARFSGDPWVEVFRPE